MSALPHISSPPPQLPPININSMPYSPPTSHAGSRPYSPYAPSSAGSFNSMTPPQGHYALPPAGMGGYAIPSYAAPTSSSNSRLAPGSGQGGYGPRGYGHSTSPGIPQNMMNPNAIMGNGSGSQSNMVMPQQFQHVNRPMSGAGVPVMKGTLRPGQEVKVGDNVVVVEKYLSEGGYAHVYLTHSSRPIGPNGLQTHCLKRIAFDDSQTDMMADTKKEIEVMKTLSAPARGQTRSGKASEETNGSRWIVEYLGSEMRRTEGRNGKGWEVFILMEFCAGGGILDLLNKRLRDRLKEREILDIFVDICEAVAHMHSLPRPLLHRDLKIENILCHPRSPSTSTASSSISDFHFKLCDFGSTTYPAERPPRSKKEADELAYDLNRHTTLQYRSPEMVEPLLGLPVGLPADVWALGVLLYKLCYYTTPFEEHGPLAIVNAKYTFPAFPVYSPLMQHLIAALLMEQPIRRPSVFDVLLKVHEMRGTRPNPKYENMPESQSASVRPIQQQHSGPARPAVATSAEAHAQMVASIQPQRRGRPGRGAELPSASQAPAQIPAVAAALSAMKAEPASQPPASGGPRQKAFQMQLTGDNPAGQGSGTLPPGKAMTSTHFDMDFGDAFKPGQETATSTKSARPDLLDTIDSPISPAEDLAKAFSPTSDNASTARASVRYSTVPAGTGSTGFADSFGSPNDSGPSPTIHANKSSSLPSKPLLSRMELSSSSSAQHLEASFEDRFPSIEALTSGEEQGTGRMQHGVGLRQESAASGGERSSLLPSGIAARPQYQGMSSFRASLTGEQLSSNDSHKPSLAVDGRTLSRSNHVTGSAFMSKPPSQDRPTVMRIGSAAIPLAQDQPSSELDHSPTSATSAKYGAIRLEDSPPPLHRQPSSLARDLLTDDDSLQVKAGYLTMVPQQNGKSAGGRGPPPTTNKPRHLSLGLGKVAPPSVEVESPPSSAGSKPQLPAKPQALTTTRQDSVSERASPLHGVGEGDRTLAVDTGGTGLRRSATERAKSPSNFASTPVSASTSLQELSPPSRDSTEQYRQTSPSERARPAPERRSSINDIVSRFERMSSPPRSPEAQVPPTSMLSRSDSQRGLSKVSPQVAGKPAALKPSGSFGYGVAGSSGASRDGSSALPAPIIKPVARYGHLPGVDQPASTSPPAAPPLTQSTTTSDPPAGGSTQRESIKSRIAMWNQAGPPVAVSSGPPALKPKPTTLGSGRRL